MKKNSKKFLAFGLLIFASLSFMLTQCKKDTETVIQHDTTYVYPADTGVFVPGHAKVDTGWTCDQTHCNVNWQSRYYDFSSTMLTGRFNNFNFRPKLNFDEDNLSGSSINFWVQLSTYNTGQPGRDGLGKCGLNYLGITYLDSNKTQVDPQSDTAWFHMTSITVDPHEGYIMHGTFTFNRWLNAPGHANGDPITKNVDAHLSYNGMRDFDSNNDGTTDKYRAGFTATLAFNRSDFMDANSTVPYYMVPKVSELTSNVTAANNKTYGVWSVSVGDAMYVVVNGVFYKNH